MKAIKDKTVAGAVAGYFDALRRRDETAWLALFADDAVQHDPVGAPEAEDQESRKHVWNILTAPFQSLDIQERRVFHAGSGAAVLWSAEALGVSGGAAQFEGITVFEIGSDGRIQALMSYWDPAQVLLELAGETAPRGDSN